MAEFIKNPKNTYVFGLLVLFVTMYGPRLSPKLPKPIQKLFENSLFRSSIMFFAIYMAQHDIKVALIVTIVFMLLMNVVQNSNLFETFLQNYEKNMEGFAGNQQNVCGPSISLTSSQSKKLLKGERDCIDSIKQWFGCQGGKPLTTRQTKNKGLKGDSSDSINPDDNITLKMMNFAKQMSENSKEGQHISDEIKNWCLQVPNMSNGNPYKERLAEACINTTGSKVGKCNPSLWDAENEGGAVHLSSAVPDFYKGPCALINQDNTNQVFYKPQCFDKKPNGKCSQYSEGQCKSHGEDCFWMTDGGSFSTTSVKADPNNPNLKLECIPKNYTNGEFKCSSQTNFGSNVVKNSPNSRGVMGAPGCVSNTTIKNGSIVEVAGQCHHSGQCCGFKGDRPKGSGSHCLTTSGKCINLDTSNSTNFDKSWQSLATVLKDKGDITADQQQLEYSKDWANQSAKYKSMFSPTTQVKPSWETDVNVDVQGKKPSGLDWPDVYYGDSSSKSKNPNNPTYPRSLYQDDSAKNIGLGCWVPNEDVISKDTKWFASVDPNEPKTQKQQGAKKEFRTINYHSGYGVVHDLHEGFTSQRCNENSDDIGHHAPPVSSCSAYNPSSMKFIGTATYPMSPNNNLLTNQGNIPYRQPGYQGEVNWHKSV